MSCNLIKSNDWYNECKDIIPACCSTLAKSPNKLVTGISPFCAMSASGSHFIDVDGNEWLDCEMAMGSVIWGHAHPEICKVLAENLSLGSTFSIPSVWELETAKKLLHRYKGFSSVKFFKNGADCVYAAIRSSRYLTKKNSVLFCEYHGWLDWCSYSYYNTSPQEMGISDSIEQDIIFSRKSSDTILHLISENKNKLACIVLCPTSFQPDVLEKILLSCRKYGIYSIFDEVSTGVRYGRYGYTGEYHLNPDFLCVSKGLSNGLPLAAVFGSQETILIMEQLKISNAHSSENTAFWATLACEELLENTPNYPSWRPFAEGLMAEINQVLDKAGKKDSLKLHGYHGSFYISSGNNNFYQDRFRLHLIKYLGTYNIFTKGYILLSEAHTESELEKIRKAILDAIIYF